MVKLTRRSFLFGLLVAVVFSALVWALLISAAVWLYFRLHG